MKTKKLDSTEARKEYLSGVISRADHHAGEVLNAVEWVFNKITSLAD